ncbi:hypothetical protein EUTSA_v10022106mg [Eutrema salsugineum]|uniref:MATH domain-containing protein n=2 Tax=Eutrema salsugineum TaxID=72664 RepID=V4NN11_EUTSA|nr:hypothetical protein EUTSA_v10022106mg [Eutrema salsugineum]
MSYYKDTLCIISLLSCLFITSSFAGPVPNVENSSQKLIPTQISSRDTKASSSSTVKGLRERPPSSYSIKLESFNTLMKSTYTERYESRPFRVGRYNWTLIVYPKGNKNDNGTRYISLYVAIDNSTLVSPGQVVPADLRFYVFNKKQKKYFTIQDSDVWQFNVDNTMLGFPRVLPLATFNNLKNGYLYDTDRCEFGVDVIIPPLFEKSELFTVNKSFPNSRFTWFIQGFSTLPSDYLSEEFTIGGKSWNLRVFRNGFGAHEGKNLSLYLNLGPQELLKAKPYDKIYVRAKLRVPNQGQSNYVLERPIDNWFSPQNIGWGYADFMALSDLRDPAKGFVRHDMLVVQVEMEAISSTKYLPS